MNVIAGFTLVPVSAGLSLSKYVAACVEILETLNINFKLHANGTNIEGSWDEVFEAIKACQIKVHEMGVERIFTTISVGTRIDKEQKMESKVSSVQDKISR